MATTTEVNGIIWTRDYDGDHNEWFATIEGIKLTVSSNLDGDQWTYKYGEDGDLCDCDAEFRNGAMQEAIASLQP